MMPFSSFCFPPIESKQSALPNIMLTLQAAEVEMLIIPSFIIFLLFIFPLPVVSRVVSKIVLMIESVNISGISLLFVLTGGACFLFVNQLTRARQLEDQPRDFHDLSAKLDFQAKKWKSERDMYIHAVTFILLAAVMKFARLIRENDKLRVVAGEATNTAAASKKKQ